MTYRPDQPSPHYSIRPDWLQATDSNESVIDSTRRIVDSHHHLWHRPDGRYLFHDFLEDINTSGHNVIATLFMECGAMYRDDGPPALRSLGETTFAHEAAIMGASGQYGNVRVCAAIIGNVDLRIGPGIEEILSQHMDIAGGTFRGVRQIAAWHDNPAARGSLAHPPNDLLRQTSFRAGLKCLSDLNLCYETYAYHTQLGDVIDVARALPDLVVVLNHIGGPIGIGPYRTQRDSVFRQWRSDMHELARCDNVYVKIGGMGMRVFGFGFGDRRRAPCSVEVSEAWAPYIHACVEAFGTTRCLFESNFPVDKGSCSYRVIWNAFKRTVALASEAEKDDLFECTASTLYRLEIPAA